jgi:serine/threonine protein kinase
MFQRCERLYALTKVLGRGNFASVFLARDKETGQEVAIKVLNKSRLIKPKQHKSIQTEIGVMMSLQKHVNTIEKKNYAIGYTLTLFDI